MNNNNIFMDIAANIIGNKITDSGLERTMTCIGMLLMDIRKRLVLLDEKLNVKENTVDTKKEGCVTHIRIGNIEYRTCRGNEEIVQWSPNGYYGRESEYEYDETTDSYSTKDGIIHISGNLFRSPETCIVVAFVQWNKTHDEFNLRTVGIRPWEMHADDTKSFITILKYIEEVNNV